MIYRNLCKYHTDMCVCVCVSPAVVLYVCGPNVKTFDII
jgi:hypothetical protein